MCGVTCRERADPAPLLNAGAPSSEPVVDDRSPDEHETERRGGDADGGEEVERERERIEDGCLIDASFEEINRLTPATIASSLEGHNLSS